MNYRGCSKRTWLLMSGAIIMDVIAVVNSKSFIAGVITFAVIFGVLFGWSATEDYIRMNEN